MPSSDNNLSGSPLLPDHILQAIEPLENISKFIPRLHEHLGLTTETMEIFQKHRELLTGPVEHLANLGPLKLVDTLNLPDFKPLEIMSELAACVRTGRGYCSISGVSGLGFLLG